MPATIVSTLVESIGHLLEISLGFKVLNPFEEIQWCLVLTCNYELFQMEILPAFDQLFPEPLMFRLPQPMRHQSQFRTPFLWVMYPGSFESCCHNLSLRKNHLG